MKLLVLNNMSSGIGDAAIFDYMRTLASDGDEIVLRSTDGTTDIRLFLHDADSFDLVVVSGNDKTISSVAHYLADTGIPVLPFPAGNANLLAQNLESPSEIHALVKLTRQKKLMDFDLGLLKFPDGKEYGFLLLAGAGFDASIMLGAEAGKKVFGPVAYLTSAIANATPQYSQITLDIDGQHLETSGVGVLIMNFSRIAFDINVVHDSLPIDGYFDIVVLNSHDAYGLLPALFDAFLDRDGDHPMRSDAFQIMRAKTVRIDANPPLPVQFDGEVISRTTPFEAKVSEKVVRFVVSDQCLKTFK